MSILSELGIDPEDFRWEDLSLCSTANPDLFFEAYETDSETAKQVDQMCLHCPVMEQCYAKGESGMWGVWGGVYWNGSGRPDATRNQHKTPEIWDEIDERLEAWN